MTLVKFNKSGNMIPSMLSNFFDNDNFLTNSWFEKEFNQSLPALNVKENTGGFEIDLAAPGFKKTDFKITTEGGVLTISAEKQTEKNEEKKHFTRKEFSYESFTRTLQLPENSLSEKIEAKYDQGILKLNLPKKEIADPKVKKEIAIA